MFDNFEHLRIDTGELEISCVVAGVGAPILLLHGFPQTMAIWATIAPALVKLGYQVICADLRGYGASDKPCASVEYKNYSFRCMAADQIKLMQALGHKHFHVIGHDRGARAAYRLALDNPEMISSLTIMDIVPTDVLLKDIRKDVAQSYWHWYFLAQPAPFPEQIILKDPDYFFQACLFGWGGASEADFNPEQLAAYRESWRNPKTVSGFCNDYRATLAIDFDHDIADQGRKVSTPTLVMYGENSVMARLYDIPSVWSERCSDLKSAAVPGGHFFPDSSPAAVVERLHEFLKTKIKYRQPLKTCQT